MPQPTVMTRPQALLFRLFGALVVLAVCSPVSGQDGADAKRRTEAIRLTKPLMKDFEQARKDFRRKDAVFKTILSGGPKRGASDRQKLEEGLQHHLYMMTNPQLELPELQEQRSKYVRLIDTAGRTINNPNQRRQHRENVFSTVSRLAKDLLDGNFYVRLQAIAILGSMNLESRPTVVPYTGSRDTLIQIARDPDQFLDQRLLALRGLYRMVKYGNVPGPDEAAINGILAAELMRDGLPSGYYFELAEMIAAIHVTFEVQGELRPIGIIACVKSMTDSKRSWRARAAAAKAIGNTGDGDASVRWPVLAWKVAEFAHAAGTEYNRQMGIRKRQGNKAPALFADVVDNEAVFDVFLAYHHETRADAADKRGLLNRSQDPSVRAAYDKVLPLVKGAIGNDAIAPQALMDLQTWLQGNVPQQLQYHPKAPPITVSVKAEAGAANQSSANTSSPPDAQ